MLNFVWINFVWNCTFLLCLIWQAKLSIDFLFIPVQVAIARCPPRKNAQLLRLFVLQKSMSAACIGSATLLISLPRWQTTEPNKRLHLQRDTETIPARNKGCKTVLGYEKRQEQTLQESNNTQNRFVMPTEALQCASSIRRVCKSLALVPKKKIEVFYLFHNDCVRLCLLLFHFPQGSMLLKIYTTRNMLNFPANKWTVKIPRTQHTKHTTHRFSHMTTNKPALHSNRMIFYRYIYLSDGKLTK